MSAVPALRGDLPADFVTALDAIAAVRPRPEITLVEVAAPKQLAPYAAAVSATVADGGDEVAHGRLILLCDPAGHEAWAGTLRLVTYLRTGLESAMVTDPMLPEVAWSWLAEALAAHQADAAVPSGTVTRVQSHPFGELTSPGDAEDPVGDLEIRASWSPVGPVAAHLEAWLEVLCTAGGLPPLPPGVVSLPGHGHSPARTGREGHPAIR
ncbi:MAG: DUF3000 domain-containing protein [Sporichthyaceae bacterium]